MKLDDIERNIIVAERDYRTTQEKLNYVNLRMGYQVIQKGTQTLITKNPTKLITKSSYYYKLNIMNTKVKERATSITRGRLANLVNEHDRLQDDRIDVRELLNRAKGESKFQACARFKILQIELGQRIASLEETIYYLTTDGKYHINEMEFSKADEDQLNEKIRLFANLT